MTQIKPNLHCLTLLLQWKLQYLLQECLFCLNRNYGHIILSIVSYFCHPQISAETSSFVSPAVWSAILLLYHLAGLVCLFFNVTSNNNPGKMLDKFVFKQCITRFNALIFEYPITFREHYLLPRKCEKNLICHTKKWNIRLHMRMWRQL